MTTTTLETSISSLLTNKRRVNALKALGVVSVADALTYYPFRVTPPVPVRTLSQAQFGEKMACVCQVRSVRINSRNGFRLEIAVDDQQFASEQGQPAGVASLVFFSHRKSYVDWMAARLQSGLCIVIAGDPSIFNNRLQFTHPEVLTVADPNMVHNNNALRFDADTVEQALERVVKPRPVYHANSRISSEHIHETIDVIIDSLVGITRVSNPLEPDNWVDSQEIREQLAEKIPDIIPESIRESKQLMHRADALYAIHNPQTVAQFYAALRTMRYEEALVCQCALLMARERSADGTAYECAQTQLQDEYIQSLPFALTNGQREVIDAISEDMSQDHPMQRLLQGEVGSGKTVIAIASMLQAVGSGHQAVLVAPTQVLAEQHYDSIRASVPEDVPVFLLTGGMKLAARRKVLAAAASGEPCIVVATHAAFSKSFQAPNLALVVIDEQHRFGVEQRDSLREKSDVEPHVLVMTATPIPRTAAMTWFGDLDISWLTELPGGRKPIRTFIIPETDGQLMADMFWHIRKRIDAGERAYIICARIDADTNNDTDDISDDELVEQFSLEDDNETQAQPLYSVAEIAERLQSLPQFEGVNFCTLTGRDDDATKKQVMADFESGKTPIMVATTVVEVGVDVPKASCIAIFDADRYGLSQLHQLRGRVGRGGTESWAFLVSRAQDDSIAQERLEAIAGTLDGAEIASKDLELRGAGDVLGDSQSGGKSSLKLLRVVKDADIIQDARQEAQQLLEHDSQCKNHVQLAGAVLDFTRGNEQYLTSN